MGLFEYQNKKYIRISIEGEIMGYGNDRVISKSEKKHCSLGATGGFSLGRLLAIKCISGQNSMGTAKQNTII